MGSWFINSYRSTYLSTFFWSLSGSAWKYGFVGVTDVEVGNPSLTMWVGDGSGGVAVRSTESTSGVVTNFTFFALGCFASSTMNFLNCSSTDTLFLAASSKISAALVCSSCSSSNSSMRISIPFPFPLTGVLFFYRALDISKSN